VIRVVIADDESDVCLLLKLQFGFLADFEVVGIAGDGASAVDLCRTLKPDAVVMDLLMPATSGFEAIDELQADMPDVRIVAYSGVAGDFVRDRMGQLGVPLVLKSGDVGALADAIRAAVRADDRPI
jgi:two-component system, NarL family, nitrate/nitrite response regulator NarL